MYQFGEITLGRCLDGNYSGWIKRRFFLFLYEARKAHLRQGYGGASPDCPAVALAKVDGGGMINDSPKIVSHQRGLTIRGGTEATLVPRHFAYPEFMFNPRASSLSGR